MKRLSPVVTLVACLFAANNSFADDTVVTVSPESMHGWSIVTHKGGRAGLTNSGPAVFERSKPFTADDGKDLGRGAFHISLGFEGGTTPPTAWLGLDTSHGRPLAGVALKRITGLRYYAYSAHLPVSTNNPKNWMSWSLWWTYPKQPVQLQLTAQSPDGKQRRQFWFMPWQKYKIRGENSGRHCKKWLCYDAVQFNAPGPNMCGRWFSHGLPRQTFDSWDELIKSYGDWTLVPTSEKAFVGGGWKSAGWDDKTDPAGAPACTATGMCLNFVAGARRDVAAVYDDEATRWANDYRGFDGYVDAFTLGIDGKDVTYNFEPARDAATPKIVDLSAKEAAALKTDSADFVRITGTVIERTNAMFALDDGSGTIVRGFLYKDVKTPENPARVGERWTVWGRMQRVPFQPADTPPLIWTCPQHMSKKP